VGFGTVQIVAVQKISPSDEERVPLVINPSAALVVNTGTDIEGLWLWNITPVRNIIPTKYGKPNLLGQWQGRKVVLLRYVHRMLVLRHLEMMGNRQVLLKMSVDQNHLPGNLSSQ